MSKPEGIRARAARVALGAAATLVAAVWMGTSNPQAQQGGSAPATAVNPDDILYILPVITWTPTAMGPATTVLRSKFVDAPTVKFGFSNYIDVKFENWNVGTNSSAALRAALASTITEIDQRIGDALANGYPLALNLSHAQRSQTDGSEISSQLEDLRNMQWYQDNRLAPGWWSTSRYARKQLRIQEAYWREVGRILADRMARYPGVFVFASGDAEVELSLDRAQSASPDQNTYADYSPFAIAEFRDWIRAGGLYATGQPYAGQGWELSSRYAGDASPGTDTNGDGHTFNGDFGTSFSTWALKLNDWSLTDSETAGAVSGTGFATSFCNTNCPSIPVTTSNANGFDAPRARPATVDFASSTVTFWKLWLAFRSAMLQRHNTLIAQWVTTSASTDPGTAGALFPATRWSSYQIAADYLFGGSPASPNGRYESSGSALSTGDVSPYGIGGFTAFNLNLKDRCGDPAGLQCMFPYFLTLKNLAPAIAARDIRYSLLEWHPSVKVDQNQTTDNQFLYDTEFDTIKKYRPTTVAPFIWEDANGLSAVAGNPGFEALMNRIATELGQLTPSSPIVRWDGLTANNTSMPTSFTITGYAIDFAKVRGSGRDTGLENLQMNLVGPTGNSSVLAPTFGIPRSDVANGFASRQFLKSGFSVDLSNLTAGTYRFRLTGRSTADLSNFSADSPTFVVSAPTLAVDHPSLLFSALKSGGVFTSVTDAQSVGVSQTGPVKSWTATSNQPWLKVTPGNGSGSRGISVSIDTAQVPATATTALGTITIATTDNSLPAVTVSVTLKVTTITSSTTTSPPTGSFDTPTDGQAVGGTIAVTGWALDDIGITRVEIWRDAHSSDAPAGVFNNRVFIGNANFLEGARPDVESINPNAPRAYRAGWGYIMLTRGLVWDGRGQFRLYAMAHDVEGNITQLGSKRITVNNATSQVPFGAIDTPGQGETVSGLLLNFGWVLAAPGRTISETGVEVYIDGKYVGSPNAGSNRSDLDAAFGPQGFDTSHANRVLAIDTTKLSNGVHQIGWLVKDDLGNADGVGSRFFKVDNSTSTGSIITTATAAIVPASLRAPAKAPAAAAPVRTAWTPPAETPEPSRDPAAVASAPPMIVVGAPAHTAAAGAPVDEPVKPAVDPAVGDPAEPATAVPAAAPAPVAVSVEKPDEVKDAKKTASEAPAKGKTKWAAPNTKQKTPPRDPRPQGGGGR